MNLISHVKVDRRGAPVQYLEMIVLSQNSQRVGSLEQSPQWFQFQCKECSRSAAVYIAQRHEKPA